MIAVTKSVAGPRAASHVAPTVGSHTGRHSLDTDLTNPAAWDVNHFTLLSWCWPSWTYGRIRGNGGAKSAAIPYPASLEPRNSSGVSTYTSPTIPNVGT